MGSPNQTVLAAVCRCDKGSAPSTLVTSAAPSVSVQGRMVATIADVQFAGRFGNCTVLCGPCAYAPAGPWSMIVSTLLYGGKPPLVQGAQLPCAVGGLLSVIEVNQTRLETGRPTAAELAEYAEDALAEDCLDPEYLYRTQRRDVLVEAADGTAVILNNVTGEEVDEYLDRDRTQAFIDELDAYRADPLGYLTHEAISGLAGGGAGVVEGRANNRRNGIPVTRAR